MSELEKIEIHHKLVFDEASDALNEAMNNNASPQTIEILRRQRQNAKFTFDLTSYVYETTLVRLDNERLQNRSSIMKYCL